MRMNCPVCGAKMVDGLVCKYCGTTENQVKTASNKQAKMQMKLKHRENVCYSTYLPSDVNKKKLTLLAIFLGLFGGHSFYVGKYVKASYSLISTSLAFVSQILLTLCQNNDWPGLIVYENIRSVFVFFTAIALIMWIADIIGIIAKTFKVPVVLGTEKIAKFNKKEGVK